MEDLITRLLDATWDLDTAVTGHDLLLCAGEIIQEHWQTAVFVAYELIPEIGGVPQTPPVCLGTFQHEQQSLHVLAHVPHTGMLADFIRHGRPVFEKDAPSWCGIPSTQPEQADYSRFIELEGIAAFLFLPLQWQQDRLGAIFLNFRDAAQLDEHLPTKMQGYTAVLALQLAHILKRSGLPQDHKKQMAVAHTYYGGAVAMFKGQVDALQEEIQDAIGGALPEAVQAQLDTVKRTVFDVMRNLVIDVSGDVLVDLKTMSLSKALNTTAAALQRAWPVGQKVTIDIPPIPAIIERQPMSLRRLLYALALELVGNAIKHGGPAPYVNVDISWAEHEIMVQVIDHGYGFDLKKQPFSEHGLGFWQDYIDGQLRGEFRVASQLGFGTVVTTKIPVLS